VMEPIRPKYRAARSMGGEEEEEEEEENEGKEYGEEEENEDDEECEEEEGFEEEEEEEESDYEEEEEEEDDEQVDTMAKVSKPPSSVRAPTPVVTSPNRCAAIAASTATPILAGARDVAAAVAAAEAEMAARAKVSNLFRHHTLYPSIQYYYFCSP
jgi:cobalamin biosynthesis protein CobT